MNCIVTGANEYLFQKEDLEEFGNFLGLKEIRYEDLGKAERYFLVKENGETAEIMVGGNHYDGGYMNTKVL